MGVNYIYAEDIISECILKLKNDIDLNKYSIDSISRDGVIHYNWFKRGLINRCLDRKRHSKTSKAIKICPIDCDTIRMTAEEEQNEYTELVPKVREALKDFESKSQKNKEHVKVFKTLLNADMNASKLSRIVNIDRRKISKSNNIVKQEIKLWLSEEKNR